jgi:N-acetylneuraminic acid mutarotase
MLYLLLFGLMMSTNILHWEESARMPLPRAGYMAGAVSDRLLLAGGSYWENGAKHWSSRADLFDPSTGRWLETAAMPEETAAMPEERSDAACVSVNGVLYVLGGGAGEQVRKDALAFEHGQWHRLPAADLPAPRLYASAVAIGARIFVAGGIAQAGNYQSASNEFWTWDSSHPALGWQVLPPVPGSPRFTHAMVAYQNRVYIFGGATAGPPDVRNLSDAVVFDPAANRWDHLPDLPFARRAWGGVVYGHDLLLLGGYTNTYETEIYRFDSATGKLHAAGALLHPYAAAIFVSVNGRLVVAGGETADRVRAPWTLVAHLSQ